MSTTDTVPGEVTTIETVSPLAKVAENAAQAIAEAEQELSELQTASNAMRAEMADLRDEYMPAEQHKAELAEAVAAAQAELQKAELSEQLCRGTSLEEKAQAATLVARKQWEADCLALQQHEDARHERSVFIPQRLEELQRGLADAAQRSQGLQAKLPVLHRLYDEAHAEHGKDVQAQLEAAFADLAERRTIAEQRIMGALDSELAELLDQIGARLKAWPALARETLAQHSPTYQPSPWVRLLRAWETVAQITGAHPKVIDERIWQIYLGETSLPLWHLLMYGASGKDEPIRRYNRMLGELRALVERLEQTEKEQQAAARLK